jgi:hypothetical protein
MNSRFHKGIDKTPKSHSGRHRMHPVCLNLLIVGFLLAGGRFHLWAPYVWTPTSSSVSFELRPTGALVGVINVQAPMHGRVDTRF